MRAASAESSDRRGILRFRLRLVFSLSIFILIPACQQNAPAPIEPEPEPQPLLLGDLGSHPLIFKNVSYRIPTGTILGEVRVQGDVVDEMRWTVARSKALDFNVSITDAMRDLGYNMRDSADALFDPTGEVKIRFAMAAILHTAVIDFEYEYSRRRRRRVEGVGTADVEVEVHLHDAVANKTVYKRTFSGHGEDAGLKPNPIISAVVNATLKATTDPEFVRLVSKGPIQEELAAPSVDQLELTACPGDESVSLPRDLSRILDAVIEIQVGSSMGTGVIVSPDGWIVTAAHVIGDAAEIWVRFPNGAQVPATLQESNTEFDVALLRIAGRDYPCSRIRSAAQDLELGSDVFAVNLALGEIRSPTVTRGVVSGYPERQGKRFIQTDASLNPGSSGGPLFASDGTIAGITVRKIMGAGIEGLGFAVPIQDVVHHLSVRIQDD
jgi:S1-C subfamily serine protease